MKEINFMKKTLQKILLIMIVVFLAFAPCDISFASRNAGHARSAKSLQNSRKTGKKSKKARKAKNAKKHKASKKNKKCKNIPPPYLAAKYGNRQILPSPTAEPAAARTNPNLLPKLSFFSIKKSFLFPNISSSLTS